MSVPIVILEDSSEVAVAVAALLGRGGFETRKAATKEEALRAMGEAAPRRAVLLVSSTIAAALGPSFDELLAHDPRPVVALTCTRPGDCPLHPGMPCANMGCLNKPEDLVGPNLVARLREIIDQQTLDPGVGDTRREGGSRTRIAAAGESC
jgi:hypothetical protein